jgi:hypothetical protein
MLVMLTACSDGNGGPQGKATMDWQPGSALSSALAEAKTDSKPLLLYFTATW